MKNSKSQPKISTYKSLIIMLYYQNNISFLKQLQSKYNFTFKQITKNGLSGGNPEYIIQSLSKQTLNTILDIIYTYNIHNNFPTKTYPIINHSKFKKQCYPQKSKYTYLTDF